MARNLGPVITVAPLQQPRKIDTIEKISAWYYGQHLHGTDFPISYTVSLLAFLVAGMIRIRIGIYLFKATTDKQKIDRSLTSMVSTD